MVGPNERGTMEHSFRESVKQRQGQRKRRLCGGKFSQCCGCKNKCSSEHKEDIKTLVEILLASVNAMEEIPEWEEVEMAVDSGATETVVGEDMIQGIETTQGEGARRGVQYEVASGDLIPNLGGKNFPAYGEHGQVRAIKAQVCEVNKALLSVSRMVHAGNEAENTGERIPLREQGGMYMLKLWAKSQSVQRHAEETW